MRWGSWVAPWIVDEQRAPRTLGAAARSIVLVVALALCACSSAPPKAHGTYTVKRGDTLYAIARRHGLDYRDLARWNGIGRDYRIYPGQVLRLRKILVFLIE